MEDNVKLITDRLQETIGLDEMKTIIAERPLKIYWGTAPTGRIHIGYLIPLLKIADFLNAGCHVKILFADLHAMLDNLKSTPELISFRCVYYQKMIKSILTNLKVPLDKLEFVNGTSFQLTPKYTTDMYKLTTLLTTQYAKKAGAEVVKQTENPKLSGLLYPLLQALDEEYLDVDCQFGGIDQRKIFTMASEVLPLIGYKKRIHLMNPMLPATNAMPPVSTENKTDGIIEKMSSSDIKSKIDILDTEKETTKKITSMYSLEGDLTFNPLMDMYRMVIFPLLKCLGNPILTVVRPEKYGGNATFNNYEELSKAFVEKAIHPADLKKTAAKIINDLFKPIRLEFTKETELLKNAYP
jgi:tyrosyl-tRNA synthetase